MATNLGPDDIDEREHLEPDARAIDDDRARLARAANELEAAKARVERDAHLVHEETRSKLVSELLPMLDNVDRAIAAAEANADAPTVVEGVGLVRRQLETILRRYGLERFDAVGMPFDPNIHDACSVLPVGDPAQDRLVVEQLEAGYRFGERLLRAAKVVVGKHP